MSAHISYISQTCKSTKPLLGSEKVGSDAQLQLVVGVTLLKWNSAKCT